MLELGLLGLGFIVFTYIVVVLLIHRDPSDRYPQGPLTLFVGCSRGDNAPGWTCPLHLYEAEHRRSRYSRKLNCCKKENMEQVKITRV